MTDITILRYLNKDTPPNLLLNEGNPKQLHQNRLLWALFQTEWQLEHKLRSHCQWRCNPTSNSILWREPVCTKCSQHKIFGVDTKHSDRFHFGSCSQAELQQNGINVPVNQAITISGRRICHSRLLTSTQTSDAIDIYVLMESSLQMTLSGYDNYPVERWHQVILSSLVITGPGTYYFEAS